MNVRQDLSMFDICEACNKISNIHILICEKIYLKIASKQSFPLIDILKEGIGQVKVIDVALHMQ